jgi:hypothetical protein
MAIKEKNDNEWRYISNFFGNFDVGGSFSTFFSDFISINYA